MRQRRARRLRRLERMLQTVLWKLDTLQLYLEKKMAQNLERLRKAVEKNNEVGDSTIALLNGIAAQIRANATDEQAMLDLATQLEGQNQEFADAITANTPAAPEPAPSPAPEPAPTASEEAAAAVTSGENPDGTQGAARVVDPGPDGDENR